MAHVEYIESADDPRVAVYRCVRDAELLAKHNACIAEGELVVTAALTDQACRFPVRSALLSASRLAAMADAIDAAPQGVPVYAAHQDAIDAIAGFPLHRGVLAALDAAPRKGALAWEHAVGAAPERAVFACAEGLANHDNVGGLFRLAAAFGAGGVLLDERSCDPLYRKAIRVSMGNALRVRYAQRGLEGNTGGAMLRALDALGVVSVAMTTAKDAAPLGALCAAWAKEGRPARVAVLVGAEGGGLSAAAMRQATVRAAIPMAPGIDSLNVVSAAAIAMQRFYELG